MNERKLLRDISEAYKDCMECNLDVTTSAIQLYLYGRDRREVYTREEIASMCFSLASMDAVFNNIWLNR